MIAIIISSGVLFLLSILLVRTVMFSPSSPKAKNSTSETVDAESAVRALSELIKCKTVSNPDRGMEDDGEFSKLRALLPTLFPKVFASCHVEFPTDRAILIKWSGKSSDSPSVFMAHYDVVSADESAWKISPFSGTVTDGELWGRGAIDTKVTMNAILSAAEKLIGEGFVPQNDVYMAFAGDEEINGTGAKTIAKLFSDRGIAPGIVLDEGGAVVKGAFPGVKSPTALIGICEKGMLNVEYSVTGGGGHSSSPEIITPVGRLSRACMRVEGKPFKYRLTSPARKLFDSVARHSSFAYRFIFANLWLFSPIINLLTRKSGGELNALVRTTTAFTVAEGSKGMNVIPPYAKMISNHRIIPGESCDSLLREIKKRVNDDRVDIKIVGGMNPSRVSVTHGECWDRLNAAISDVWSDAVISPYLMLACSDSRHWSEISDKVYRFSPLALTKEERATIHGNNEKIPVEKISSAVEFYIKLIKRS